MKKTILFSLFLYSFLFSTEVSADSDINISIYNVQGQHIETLYNGFMTTGFYSEIWNASNYSSGIYVVRMSTNTGFHTTQKVVLIK